MKKVSIVIPVHNEEGNISVLVNALRKEIDSLPYLFEIIFVDDGSTDSTLDIIRHLAELDDRLFFVQLARNYGHQNAIKAGIDVADGDCVISMDGDMQHPPHLIPLMVQKWEEGYDIVYTCRKDTEGESGFKKRSSRWFYRVMNVLAEVKVEPGAADFRLLDAKVADIVRKTKEADLFLRVIVRLTGYKQFAIDYIADERHSGKSKYSLRRMLRFALNGITSYSRKPLYMAAYLGLAFSFSALLYIPYIIYSMARGNVVSGWSSIIATIVFFGGLQLFVLGIIGIYIGKIFMQVKQRPHYIIKETNLQQHETSRFAKL